MKTQTHLIFTLFLLFILGCQTETVQRESVQSTLPYLSIAGDTGWTKYHVTYSDNEKRDFTSDFKNLMEAIEVQTSTFKPNSLITNFNKSSTSFLLPKEKDAAHHFLKNFEVSKVVYKTTDGYFDPSVMPLVNYWGFGYNGKKRVENIDNKKIKSILSYVGFDKITKSTSQNGVTIQKQFPESELDFSAIAKGYAVDCFGDLLEKNGVKNYMVEIGGEVLAKGKNKKGKLWTIGINTPKAGSSVRDFEEIIQLDNKALATSGNYRNYYEVKGEKFSHTINPKTGYTERNNLLSASIIATDCITADALATGCMSMGLEPAKKMVDSLPDVDAVFIYTEDGKTMKVYYTKGIENALLLKEERKKEN